MGGNGGRRKKNNKKRTKGAAAAAAAAAAGKSADAQPRRSILSPDQRLRVENMHEILGEVWEPFKTAAGAIRGLETGGADLDPCSLRGWFAASTEAEDLVVAYLPGEFPKLLNVIAGVDVEIVDDEEDSVETSSLGSEIDGMIARITSFARLLQRTVGKIGQVEGRES